MTESDVLIVIDLRCLSEIVLVSLNPTMLVVTTVNIHLSKCIMLWILHCSGDVAVCDWVIGACCFEIEWWSHVQESECQNDVLTLDVRRPCSLDTLDTNHQVMQCHIPEKQRQENVTFCSYECSVMTTFQCHVTANFANEINLCRKSWHWRVRVWLQTIKPLL